jgi:hypothetical protein
LFEREIGSLGPFQDLVHQHGGLLKLFHIVHPVEISPPASTNCRKWYIAGIRLLAATSTIRSR